MFQTIQPLTQAHAKIVADDWHYEGEYGFYDMVNDKEDYEEIISPLARGDRYFQITENGDLIAFFCIFPISNKDVEIGLGLRPDLTGKGLGASFLQTIEQFIVMNYAYQSVCLSVADFNLRALKLYLKSGYEKIGSEIKPSNGGMYEFICLRKDLF